jgi:hypothetical protein
MNVMWAPLGSVRGPTQKRLGVGIMLKRRCCFFNQDREVRDGLVRVLPTCSCLPRKERARREDTSSHQPCLDLTSAHHVYYHFDCTGSFQESCYIIEV